MAATVYRQPEFPSDRASPCLVSGRFPVQPWATVSRLPRRLCRVMFRPPLRSTYFIILIVQFSPSFHSVYLCISCTFCMCVLSCCFPSFARPGAPFRSSLFPPAPGYSIRRICVFSRRLSEGTTQSPIFLRPALNFPNRHNPIFPLLRAQLPVSPRFAWPFWTKRSHPDIGAPVPP